MSLSIGIVGLPNVGKSTLFNALTKSGAEASNYPFCTIDPNIGIVKVPDERLEKIAAISRPKKIVPTTIRFVDIAGLVKGAHEGEGLGNRFLAHIRECDAICEVVRNFRDDNIIHVAGKIDPEGDRETINLELIFADLETVAKRLDKAAKDAKGGDKTLIAEKTLLLKIKSHLEAEKAARDFPLESDEEKKFFRTLNLLTAKPIIYALNETESAGVGADYGNWDGKIIKLNAKLEEEIAGLADVERAEYIKELGIGQSGLDKLIRASYELLGLLTFFTTGEDETRAWTVPSGAKAPRAAGAIHTDFERGFIRAEVIGYDDFLFAGGEAEAREKGLSRTEGKDYVIRDGDICHFLFNK